MLAGSWQMLLHMHILANFSYFLYYNTKVLLAW